MQDSKGDVGEHKCMAFGEGGVIDLEEMRPSS